PSDARRRACPGRGPSRPTPSPRETARTACPAKSKRKRTFDARSLAPRQRGEGGPERSEGPGEGRRSRCRLLLRLGDQLERAALERAEVARPRAPGREFFQIALPQNLREQFLV